MTSETFQNISVPQVAPKYRRAGYVSWPNFIYTFFKLLEYLIPLIILMFTTDMWKKTGEFMETPLVEFSGNYLIIFNGKSDHLYSSSFPVLNGADIDQFRIIQHSHYWEEKRDQKILHLTMIMPTNETVLSSVTYFIFFHYNLEYHSRVQAELPLIDTLTLPTNSSKITIFGRLVPDQSKPLKDIEHIKIINTTRRDTEHYKPDEILQRSVASPLSLKLSRQNYLVQSRVSTKYIELQFNIVVDSTSYVYQNGIMDMLKWFWIQFVCLYMLMRYIIDTLFHHLNIIQYEL